MAGQYNDSMINELMTFFKGRNEGITPIGAPVILAAPAASVTFASIPQIFRHLVLFINARTNAVATADNISLRFNADAGNNYDYVILFGNNALAGSVNVIAAAQAATMVIDAANSRASCFGGGVAFIYNYANANIEKDLNSLSGNSGTPTGATKYVQVYTSHWRNVAAITSILVFPNVGPNFVANSVFQLYGIAS